MWRRAWSRMGSVGELVDGGDAAVEGAGAFGGFGGVLGDVGGDLGVGQFPAGGDGARVVFAAPGQGPGGDSAERRGLDVDGAGGLGDGFGEEVEGGPGGRGGSRSGGAVEADDGVEVDDPAALVFGDLGVGEPSLSGERLTGQPGLAGEGSAQRDGEAAPQFGGAGVEQDRAGVVVALGAQRFAELGVVSGVLFGAGQADAVWAGPAVAARAAGQHFAVSFAAGVDGTEGGCCEGGEHARVLSHGVGNAFAAGQSGPDDLVGVGAVDLSAGRALGGAAGLAGDGQDAAGFVDGGVAVEQFAGGTVDVVDAAAQQDGLQAAAGVPDCACGDGIGGQRWCSSRLPLRAVVDERRRAAARRGR